ncbi:NUDIX hydrolase [Aquisalimonas asiatica]|uniref:NUDIX domain-containing protein n=1 Tax=Aquisalimonas asiatica TaxID=406100 RepID=A0A1H8PR32_9GAMM|nr:NUDIX domain-containing protein [Aquisalimonas asiatica]SEO44236.1 NUDIX domain-containing protein [Aquisalimonas asiatica]
MPVTPKPASTVIVLRDGPPGLEVLLLKRNARTRFGPGASVFPGGAVDADDTGPTAPPCPVDETAASTELGVRRGGLAYRIAAIRECFEEAGILLARRTDGTPLRLDDPAAMQRFQAYREALRHQQTTLADICGREQLRLFGDELLYVSHWVTPAYVPKRFDTRFFLAVAPAGQEATCCGQETVDQCWVTPEAGLDAETRGALQLMTPTRDTLERLARYDSAEAVIAGVRQQRLGARIPGHGLMEQRFPDPA